MNGLVELLLGHAHDGIQLLPDRQVDGKVQAAQKLHRLLHRPVHLRLPIDVAPHPDGPASHLPDSLGTVDRPGFPKVAQGQFGAATGDLIAQHLPDAAGRPKDDALAAVYRK